MRWGRALADGAGRCFPCAPVRADELDYDLPEELIAQAPPAERDGARLCVFERGDSTVQHRRVTELAGLLPPALWVFNDTRVIPARVKAQRQSGGQVELLLLERVAGEGTTEIWHCMARPAKRLRVGEELEVPGMRTRIEARRPDGTLEVSLTAAGGVLAQLDECGEMPLPPYIRRAADETDDSRYQTTYAAEPGAVAAPTAGLHFSEALLTALSAAGHERAFVTLHVGAGTFLPLKADNLADHPMHSERYTIPEATVAAVQRARAEGRPVVAVGTTVVRTLEASAREAGELVAGSARTDLCIYPPYEFRVIDALLTNFHLPRSTLLALVMAFGGEQPVRDAYAAAVAQRYRFFSYGDAMLIRPRP